MSRYIGGDEGFAQGETCSLTRAHHGYRKGLVAKKRISGFRKSLAEEGWG